MPKDTSVRFWRLKRENGTVTKKSLLSKQRQSPALELRLHVFDQPFSGGFVMAGGSGGWRAAHPVLGCRVVVVVVVVAVVLLVSGSEQRLEQLRVRVGDFLTLQ
jgi:hypothetical protein